MDRHFYESINEGKPTCIDDDIPFDIPDSWEWVRIGEAFFLQAGKNISSGKIQNDYFVDSFPCYGGNGIRGYVDIYNRDGVYPIIGRQGALCGNVNLASGKFYATEHAVCVETYGDFNKEWVYSTLKALNLNQYATATAQPGLAVGVINAVLIPIPPIQEQQRIVNILDTENEKLDTLLQSRLRYNRILSETPTSLRQQLIQAAIQGQLVPQNPNDEPARKLLSRIAQERTAKLGKKAAKSMSRIERRGSKTYELFPDGAEKDISDEIPFEIPSSWAWVRLGNLCIKIGAGSTPKGGKAVYKENGILFLRSQNVYNNGLRLEKVAFIEPAVDESMAGSRVEPLDLLLNITGASIGRCAIVPPEIRRANVNQHVLILRCIDKSMDGFVHACIVAPFTFKHIMSLQVGATKEGLSAQNASRLLLPIPPYAEQQRIVTTLNTALAYIAL